MVSSMFDCDDQISSVPSVARNTVTDFARKRDKSACEITEKNFREKNR